MDDEIKQYLGEQGTPDPRDSFDHERHRDRMRRRDRDRDRRRRDRGPGRERDRDRERSRDRFESSRPEDFDYQSFNGYGETPTRSNNGDYDKGHAIEGFMGDDFDNYSEGSQTEVYCREGPSRDYGRDRDRDRDRDGRDRESREGRDGHRDRDYGRGDVREEKGGERWMTANPTNTILLRGLVPQIDEKDIRAELMLFGAPIKEVRLMKRKDTGVSRGFAFVEFQNVSDAQRWMEHNQGQLVMLNQYTVSMYYSTPKTGPGAPLPAEAARNAQDNWSRSDWICNKCGVHNFRRRDFCFKCNISKEESERAKEGDGFDQVGTNPCNTLIFRGLDALTTEENLVNAINQVTTHQVKNIKIIRDDLTGTSRSFGFAEMGSIQDSTELLEAIQNLKHPFEVDGKAIMVSYAKNTFTTTMATMNQTQFAAGQAAAWDFTQGTYDYGQTAYYDQTTGQYYDPVTGLYYDPQNYAEYAAYYGAEYQQQATAAAAAAAAATAAAAGTPAVPTTGNAQQDTTNAAAAVAQAAIQQAQAAKQYQKQHETMQKQIVAQMHHQQKLAEPVVVDQRLAHDAQEWSTPVATASPTASSTTTTIAASPQPTTQAATSSTEYPKYPVPDVSSYQYDETSGYYYDPMTGLYYDASTQYYYNSTTGQFMYWDGEKQTYLPAPADGQEMGEGSSEPKTKKEKEKKEKVKVAKKIAKDMEKWAKTLNAQKEAMKEGFKKSFQPLVGSQEYKESASADAGFAILEKRALTDRKPTLDVFKKDEAKVLMPPPALPTKVSEPVPGLVASYGGDSDDDDEPDDGAGDGPLDETRLVDLSKMACLLCKRQFPNKDALSRHTQLSDLHKKNLEELRKKAANSAQSIQYRDRAKERREKYGIPGPPVPKKRQISDAGEPYEQPTRQGIGHDNIGNKLLQKMGWSKGQGLGKANQGIVDPIQAMHRQQQAGLGARGSNYQVTPGDSYKETVKKVMFARYQELQ